MAKGKAPRGFFLPPLRKLYVCETGEKGLLAKGLWARGLWAWGLWARGLSENEVRNKLQRGLRTASRVDAAGSLGPGGTETSES